MRGKGRFFGNTLVAIVAVLLGFGLAGKVVTAQSISNPDPVEVRRFISELDGRFQKAAYQEVGVKFLLGHTPHAQTNYNLNEAKAYSSRGLNSVYTDFSMRLDVLGPSVPTGYSRVIYFIDASKQFFIGQIGSPLILQDYSRFSSPALWRFNVSTTQVVLDGVKRSGGYGYVADFQGNAPSGIPTNFEEMIPVASLRFNPR